MSSFLTLEKTIVLILFFSKKSWHFFLIIFVFKGDTCKFFDWFICVKERWNNFWNFENVSQENVFIILANCSGMQKFSFTLILADIQAISNLFADFCLVIKNDKNGLEGQKLPE